jgi:parallel beta-helix repeat protein
VLANDLVGTPSQNCLIIDTDNVRLDCANHAITSSIFVYHHNNITVSNCRIGDGGIDVATGSNIVIDRNVFYSLGTIALGNGSRNQITSNMIDGGYHGHNGSGQGGDAPGQDDGIVLGNQDHDVVQDNTIMNVFDAGIEGVDAVTNTVIANNTVTNAILAGIGSYHCTHWASNTVNGNRVSSGQFLIDIFLSVDALCAQPPPSGEFVDNQITNNVFRDPLGELATTIDFSTSSTASMVSNNLIQGNDFGPQHVRLSPITGFINGGGNVCDAGLNIPSFRDFYLNCGKSAGSASVGADRAARHADLGSGSILRGAPGLSSVGKFSHRDPLY